MRRDTEPELIPHAGEHGSYKTYVSGFILSIILTMISYTLADLRLLTGFAFSCTLVILGFVQAMIQMVLFLHLGEEEKPRWNLMVFLFMALVVVVIVGGSLWIMYNLDYRVM